MGQEPWSVHLAFVSHPAAALPETNSLMRRSDCNAHRIKDLESPRSEPARAGTRE
jgi:hypothetical protein